MHLLLLVIWMGSNPTQNTNSNFLFIFADGGSQAVDNIARKYIQYSSSAVDILWGVILMPHWRYESLSGVGQTCRCRWMWVGKEYRSQKSLQINKIIMTFDHTTKKVTKKESWSYSLSHNRPLLCYMLLVNYYPHEAAAVIVLWDLLSVWYGTAYIRVQ